MFEQESYDKATVQAPSQPGELFHNYEIKPWNYSATLYKILAASAVLNLAVLAFIGQSNMLTMRGCDSPWAGRVCQVLDMAYMGALIYGTEREYVDEAYEKTDLGEAEITFIDVTGETPPLTYPEGYFQIANPVQYAMLKQAAEGSTDVTSSYSPLPSSETDMMKIRPNPPIANSNALQPDSDLDSPFAVERPTRTVRNPRDRRRPNNGLDPDPKDPGREDPSAKATPQPTPTAGPTGPVEAVKINREVMEVFGKSVAEKLDKKEVDLTQNFKVTAVAVLTEEGKFDVTIDPKTKLQRSRVLTGDGDPAMVKVVTEAIAAIGDSGWLGYLSNEGIRNITFTFEQNDQELTANIVSEHPTPNNAGTASRQLTSIIDGVFLADRMKINVLGDDEKALLKGATATSDGKKVVLNFKFPKPLAQEMIQRNIQKAKEAETSKKPPQGLVEPGSAGTNTAAK